jgi:hypothetical protein
MILETVRIVADWLAHGTHGLNAVRTSVPKDTGIADFPAVTVLDSTRDGRVARGGVPNLAPSEFPCVLVTPADQPLNQTSPGVTPASYFTVPVLVRFATRELDTAKAERDASQVIKTVSRQLRRLFDTAAGEAARTRADVQLHAMTSLDVQTLYEAAEDTIVTGGVLVTFLIRLT